MSEERSTPHHDASPPGGSPHEVSRPAAADLSAAGASAADGSAADSSAAGRPADTPRVPDSGDVIEVPEVSKRFHSRFQAALLGSAVADALAYPHKDYSRTFLISLARPITTQFVAHPDGRVAAGETTDDTAAIVAVVRSILEAGEVDGETVADYLIPLWRDLDVVDADPGVTAAMRRLVKGMTIWSDSGHCEGHAEGGGVSRAIPVGMWHARSLATVPGRPESTTDDSERVDRIARDAATVLRITHNDPRVLGAGAGVAAAVAGVVAVEEIHLGTLLDRIGSAVETFCPPLARSVEDLPRILSQTDVKARELIESLLLDERYPPRRDGLGDYAVPVFLLALYNFLKAPTDYARAVEKSIQLGGNAGTAATITGALVGAHVGLERIPEQLLGNLAGRSDLMELSDDLLSEMQNSNSHS